jgi:integrase/recombinase XerD
VSVRFNERKDGGYWYVDTSWPDGMRTRKTMADEDTAIRINKKIEVACCDEDRIWKKLRKELRLEGGILQGLSEFADLYFESWVVANNRSQASKKSLLKTIKAHFGSTPIDSIGNMNLDKFVAARRKAGVKNATINRGIAALKHMYSWGVKRGYLESSPIASFELLEEVEWVGERPDEAVIDRIIANVQPEARPIFLFLRETGARLSEAARLERHQIDFARANVTFHSITKNGKSRQVPLTSDALDAIAAMPPHGRTVFYSPESLIPWSVDSVDRIWERARKKVMVGDGADKRSSRLRVHDLRHAYAIKLAEEGTPMHFISEMLGHHSVDFTRKRYARFSPESAGRAVLRVLEGRKAFKIADGSRRAAGT